jgi:SAM-dependent methyltransferase
MPDPGDDLISRVLGGADPAWFYWTGRESVRELERTVGIGGRTLDSFESILDFGCGCGRMLLWMEELGRMCALRGTDIDAEAIRWCREHVSYAEVTVNDADPPLAYRDGAFDLVYGHSVFTHLDEQRQNAWLSELQRVTSPRGFLVLSTHGVVTLGDDVWRIRGRLEDEGIVFIDNVFGPAYPAPGWYQRTFHAPWYVFEHWGRWFEIRAHVPGGALGIQDKILLQRRDGDAPRRAGSSPAHLNADRYDSFKPRRASIARGGGVDHRMRFVSTRVLVHRSITSGYRHWHEPGFSDRLLEYRRRAPHDA